jgi:D-alanyl-D-alanine dipeptidase
MKFGRTRRALRVTFIVLILWLVAFVPTIFGLESVTTPTTLPEGFVYVDEVIPDLVQEIRYYGTNNFMGRPVDGYNTNRAILTHRAAQALRKVQQELSGKGLGLKIFDGYRPTRAVDHFLRWAADPNDHKMKEQYYPDFEKKDLFRLGYWGT